MSIYRAYHYWSPTLGVQAVRLSMVDAHGSEFYSVIADEGGKSYRAARDTALDAIEDAIAEGQQPGEVT